MPWSERNRKEYVQWLEMDYFQRPRAIRAWRGRLSWICLWFGVLGIVAWSLIPGHENAYQARPVSFAHASFGQNCALCHVDSFPKIAYLLGQRSTALSVEDHTCNQCHLGAAHHPRQGESPSCSSCHQEHRGRVSLVGVADGHCTACHGNMATRLAEFGGATTNVTAFTRDGHPPLKIPSDPGQIKFTHATHLNPKGLLVPNGSTNQVLDCQACHQYDATGRNFAPIRYTAHCASCHPLNFYAKDMGFVSVRHPGGDLPVTSTTQIPKAGDTSPIPVRRGGSSESLRAELRDYFIQFARTNLKKNDLGDLPSAIPGRSLRLSSTREDVFADRMMPRALEKFLGENGTCIYCHIAKTLVPNGPWGEKLPKLERTNIPSRWFRKSRFDHASHRMMRCSECHQGTEESKSVTDVLIPAGDNCLRCHHKGGNTEGHAVTNQARSDCVTCHRYHDLLGEGRSNLFIPDSARKDRR